MSQLLAGRYHEAAQALLAASREQPANARYLSDVAAVQLERARLGLRPDDLPRALAAADRARRLDPSLREAWFNHALAASALSLRDQAKESWTEYLKRDSTSTWSAEARTRLQELTAPTPAAAWTAIEGRLERPLDAATAEHAVRTQMTEARNFIESNLIAKWAAAVQRGQDASRHVEQLRLMADAMQRVGGDALYRDVVGSIERAEARGGSALSQLAAAHQSYATAAGLFTQDRFAEAGPRLAAARAQLAAVQSPFAHRAAIDVAGTTLVRSDYAGTLAVIQPAKAAGHANSYAYIAARSSWFEGLVAFAQRRLGDTQAHYEDTLGAFERMGDAEQVALANNLLASFFFYLGDRPNEWRHRQGALQGLAVSRSARYRSLVLTTAGLSQREDNPGAALALYDEALSEARKSGRHIMVLEVLPQRAAALLALGRNRDATSDLREARLKLNQVGEPRLKEAYELSILATEGDQQRGQDPAAAVATATRALEIIERRNNPADRLRVPAFQLQLAKANIVWGNAVNAKVALANGIRAFDQERSLIADEGRISAVDPSWQLFEVAVQIAIEEQDYPKAFEMSERARLRTLAEARRAPAPRSLADIQSSLDADVAVVALNQLDDRLAIWVIRRNAVRVTTRPMRRVTAQELVAKQQQEIWRESAQPAASDELYQQIVRPVANDLLNVSRVVFVPDQTYQNVAFAGLWDKSGKRFLIENVTVSLSPTVDGYVTASQSVIAATAREPLILGGPDRAADTDAHAIAAEYQAPTVVTGPAATSDRFFAEAAGHAVVHISAATAASQSFPLLSRLQLSDQPGRKYSGQVLGTDIAARSMPQTKLVVLDEVEAANTARGEGTLSLARAFLAAGVPAVIGTLPGADENATRDLLIGFHREMTKGIPAAQALSTVQRNALQQNGGRLGAWSALVMYGSDR